MQSKGARAALLVALAAVAVVLFVVLSGGDDDDVRLDHRDHGDYRHHRDRATGAGVRGHHR